MVSPSGLFMVCRPEGTGYVTVTLSKKWKEYIAKGHASIYNGYKNYLFDFSLGLQILTFRDTPTAMNWF